MGRDTTANKRMAAKRSREKAAGLRRLNVALNPEVFEKLAGLMQHHNCASQAKLIELLVMNSSTPLPSRRKVNEKKNDISVLKNKPKSKKSLKKQPPKTQKNPKNKTTLIISKKELLPSQMSLFE